jgi:hypothetical protein
MTLDLRALARHWVHSIEEDAAGMMVFRPFSFPFPFRRGGRVAFDLAESGSLETYSLGEADRPTASSGRWWILDADQAQTLRFTCPGRAEWEYEIVSVEPDKLVVRPK